MCKTMIVSKQKEVPVFLHTQLEMDTWKSTFYKDEVMTESYDGKKVMEEVKQIKYMGVVISHDGKNMPDILQKKNRSLGTHKLRMNLVKGLGSYTFE